MALNHLPPMTLDRSWASGRPLIDCRYDPSGRFLFVSAEDNSIRRFDLLTAEVASFTAHTSWVRGMVFLSKATNELNETLAFERKQLSLRAFAGPIANTLTPQIPPPIVAVTGDYHGNLIWWDAHQAKPKPIRTVAAHDGWIRAVAAAHDGKMLASCGNDRLVKIWSTESGQAIRTLRGHENHVYNIAFHPNGRQLASCDLKGVVKIWDLTNGKCESQLDASVLYKYDAGFMADIGGARGMNYDAKNGRLACCGITNVSNAFAGVGNPIVALFEGKDVKPKLFKPVDAFQGTAWGVVFHPHELVIAAGGGSGGRIWMWHRNDPSLVRTTVVPANARDIALHPAGDRVAVAGANGTAYMYKFEQSRS